MISHTGNKAEQHRGGQKKTYVPVAVDNVTGSESDADDWDDVDEGRRGSMCYNCGKAGHVARIRATRKAEMWHGRCQDEVEDRRMARERRVQARMEVPRWDIGIPTTVLDMLPLHTSRRSVDGLSVDEESPASMRKIRELNHNLNEKKMVKEECGSSGTWRTWMRKNKFVSAKNTVKWKKAPGAWGTDPSNGQVNANVMSCVQFVKWFAMDSV